MIKICEHWRPPNSKHELGSGDWVNTPTKKWQNRSRPFNMNHKHVKTTWTINMWKNVTTDHYSMISGNNFPNMNCIAVIGHKLQNGDMFFLFFCFFLFFLFFLFFSLGFRASGITCIWFSIEKMFLEVKNVFVSLFFLFFFFWWKNVKI